MHNQNPKNDINAPRDSIPDRYNTTVSEQKQHARSGFPTTNTGKRRP